MGMYMEKFREWEWQQEQCSPVGKSKIIDFSIESQKVKIALKKLGIAKIQSEALDGEIIYFAEDETSVKKAPPGAVVYTMEELTALVQGPQDREGLKHIHAAKKMFAGKVMSTDN